MEKEKIMNLAAPNLVRFEELKAKMEDPSFPQDPSYALAAKEYSSLALRSEEYHQWIRIGKDLESLDELCRSEENEISEMAQREKQDLQKKFASAESAVLKWLIPRDPNDEKNIVLEIRAGAGGEEAALFVSELTRMYLRFAENKGLKSEMVSVSPSDKGGYKEAVFLIERVGSPASGQAPGPFSIFKYEMGVHRVQRVPETEAAGRIHTSTVTVAVLPEAEEVEVSYRSEDLRIDTYRASGHGGQYLQKTDSAVRITHIPSGLVIQCQDERSQQKNKEKALKFLGAKLLEMKREEQARKIAHERKKQVGTGERSEKIRTYNFPQDRITDHRIGFSIRNIQKVLDGELMPIVEALSSAEQSGV